METPTTQLKSPQGIVNITVRVTDRDRLRELAYRGRRVGQNPRTMAEQVAIVLDYYEQAHPAPKNRE